MSRINILGSSSQTDDTSSVIQSYYASWRSANRQADGFFALYNAFRDKEYLKKLDSGPLRLYLYFGFMANNTYGHSWPSIDTIAKYFDKQTRTIDYWIQELVEAGLVYRERDTKKSSSTYLIPYGDTVMRQRPSRTFDEDNQDMLDNLIKVIERRKAVYGSIVGVFHLFHWGSKRLQGPSPKLRKSNMIFVITRRENDILIGHIYQLGKSDEFGISQLNIQDPATFESPFLYMGHPVRGIAVRHTHRLKPTENHKTWLELMQDLAVADKEIFSDFPHVEYGLIEDVLDLGDDETDNDSEDEMDDPEEIE